MNLSQLERIVMVAKSGNITDVAQKLYISQPALSQTISTVEDEIGAPIFDRRAQPLKLTPEGEYFIHAARDILRANESMLQNIRNVRRPRKNHHRIVHSALPLHLVAYLAVHG